MGAKQQKTERRKQRNNANNAKTILEVKNTSVHFETAHRAPRTIKDKKESPTSRHITRNVHTTENQREDPENLQLREMGYT